MAYNRENFLKKVKEVNEIYIEHHNKGIFNEYIYKHFIAEQFHISRSTFYTYLTIPYKTQLKAIQEKKEMQLSLFA